MAKFVKKQNGTKYYQVDGYRASGIIPYFKEKGKYYVLVNTEYRSHKLSYHFLGGKVELRDRTIEDTALREANEECGFLINNIVPSMYKKLVTGNYKFVKIVKSKYISYLINIRDENCQQWLNLPNLFNKMFKDGNNILKHNESIRLDWKSFNELESNKNNLSYLGKILIIKFKQILHIGPDSEFAFL
jgi:8-oxo-dGTP pyrophosphatase MutT (NUDIX family)